MADLVHNRAKGRFAEWAERVNANDPTNAALILVVWNSTATDTVIKRLDDVAAIEADVNTVERNTSGWTRKTLDQAGGITITYDDTNDRVDVDTPDQTWTAVTTGASTDVGFAYDSDTTAGTDSNILAGTWHDFAITPDGSDITATVNVIYRAS